MKVLDEFLRGIESFKQEIILSDNVNVDILLREAISVKPKLMVYIEGITWSSFSSYSNLQVTYRNYDVSEDSIIIADNSSNIEEAIFQCLKQYRKSVFWVLASSNIIDEIDNTVKRSSVDFPNLDNYSLSSWSMKDIENVVIKMELSYKIGVPMMKSMDAAVEDEIKRLTKLLFPIIDMPDVVKCLIAHNYLACNVEYVYSVVHNPLEESFIHNAFGALIKGKAVCQGYADAYKRILEHNGIKCELISGVILNNRENHVWNLVHLKNGSCAHIDVTWDSMKYYASTEYFFKSDSHMRGTREWNYDIYRTSSNSLDDLLEEAEKYCREHKDLLIQKGIKEQWIIQGDDRYV